MGLPKFLALKSSTIKKYLAYKDEKINRLHDILQFSGEDFANPSIKFEVEVDEENRDLVHIKSHNGKYWTRADPDNFWIVAEAVERHSDQHSWSCTLFRPEEVYQPQNHIRKFRFRHVQLGHYVEPFYENNFQALLNARQASPTDNQIVEVYDKGTSG